MRRILFGILMTAALSVGIASAQGNRTPRPAGQIEVVMPDGTKWNQSRCAGKVCLIEFLFTTCPHCQQTARMLSQLHSELGPKGFQPVGAAFNEGAMMLVPQFVREFSVNFPVGVSAREKTIEFLGYPITARLMVPQVVILDRKGVIRHQSSLDGTEHLHDPARLRPILLELLAEPVAAAAGKKSVSMKTK